MANLKAVLTRPNVSSSYSRNAFDRSENHKFSYDLGVLTPFFAQPFIAGSHVKLNRSIFQRTKAVNTAAFPTVDTHCEFFYVPLRLLWSHWGSFKTGINDYNTSYAYNSVASSDPRPSVNMSETPHFNLNKVYIEINQEWNGVSGQHTIITSPAQANDASRLLDMLGYGLVDDVQGSYGTTSDSFYVNPFKLLAYQKVYFDHFRNTAYETNLPFYYNVDAWSTGDVPLPDIEVARLLTLRRVNYRRDYFKSLYPALNYVASAPNGTSWSIPDSVVKGSNYHVQPTSSNGGQIVLGFPTNSTYSYANVQQIRTAFALDKLLRASSYAPKHVKDQFEARYGVKNVESGNESVRIGAFMNDIVFQEVTASATTSDSRLGEIGAKGVGYNGNGNDIEFTCKEDCIILGLCYSMPRSSYDSYHVRNWNMKYNLTDFFIPEYMNLGLQPLYRCELWAAPTTALSQNDILGYVPRYLEYKLGIDSNHGNFVIDQPLSDFTNHTNSLVGTSSSGVSSDYFKVQSTDLDSVFVQATDSSYLTDTFITYLNVKCICNQNMSVHGQPTL